MCNTVSAYKHTIIYIHHMRGPEMAGWSVKKTTSQNLSLWPEYNNSLLFFACQLRNFEIVTLVTRQRKYFQGFGRLFGCWTPSTTRCLSIQEFPRFLSTVSSQRLAMRIDTSLVIIELWFACCMCWRTLFLMNYFGIELEMCDLYLTRLDLTKGLSFDSFFNNVWYKLCCWNHQVLELESFTPPMNGYAD